MIPTALAEALDDLILHVQNVMQMEADDTCLSCKQVILECIDAACEPQYQPAKLKEAIQLIKEV